MAPSFSAQSDGKSIRVYASNTGYFDPWAGHLTATAGGPAIALYEEQPIDTSFYGVNHFTATLPQPPGATQVVIAFLLPSAELSAPNSTVTLASPFRIAGRVPARFGRGEPLAITFSPPISPLPMEHGRVSIAFEGPCLAAPFTSYEYPLARDLPFTGSSVFDTSVVSFANETQGPFECNVTVHFRAETIGITDPAFAVGSFEGLQEQTLSSHIVHYPTVSLDAGNPDAPVAALQGDGIGDAGDASPESGGQ